MSFSPETHRIAPGHDLRLKDVSAEAPNGFRKDEAEQRLAVLKTELDVLQEQLYAAGKHCVLAVMQGMDTSGKDGAIRGVFGDVNPAGCRVESFKTPTPEELAHDFLWRVHKVTPPRGMMTVFNRSHYEDVLIVRVHELAPKHIWQARYELINQFEALLARHHDTIIMKFFLHITREEQEKRLLAREADPQKAWKLSPADWRERERWADYQQAYQDAIHHCSTEHAPWYVIPANQKWYRNLAIAEIVTATLRHYHADWEKTLQQMSQSRLAELRAFRAEANKPAP